MGKRGGGQPPQPHQRTGGRMQFQQRQPMSEGNDMIDPMADQEMPQTMSKPYYGGTERPGYTPPPPPVQAGMTGLPAWANQNNGDERWNSAPQPQRTGGVYGQPMGDQLPPDMQQRTGGRYRTDGLDQAAIDADPEGFARWQQQRDAVHRTGGQGYGQGQDRNQAIAAALNGGQVPYGSPRFQRPNGIPGLGSFVRRNVGQWNPGTGNPNPNNPGTPQTPPGTPTNPAWRGPGTRPPFIPWTGPRGTNPGTNPLWHGNPTNPGTDPNAAPNPLTRTGGPQLPPGSPRNQQSTPNIVTNPGGGNGSLTFQRGQETTPAPTAAGWNGFDERTFNGDSGEELFTFDPSKSGTAADGLLAQIGQLGPTAQARNPLNVFYEDMQGNRLGGGGMGQVGNAYLMGLQPGQQYRMKWSGAGPSGFKAGGNPRTWDQTPWLKRS